MSENGEIYTAGKNFTLPPALTGWTNSTSDALYSVHLIDVTLVVEERVIDVVADITGVRDGLEVDIG